MIQIVFAEQINNRLVLSGTIPTHVVTFQQALNIKHWKEHYQPFACIFIHPDKHDILLIRDHLGIAPLYYCYQAPRLYVGQSLPDILQAMDQKPPLCETQIQHLFSDSTRYTDKTIYQGIYRVEPGHILHIQYAGSIRKIPFWQLEPEGEPIHYSRDEMYVEHFKALMQESVHNATNNHTHIAAEFSAGLDSSAIYCAAKSLSIEPDLFMHVATPGTESDVIYNDAYEKALIAHYQLHNIHRINADGFDALDVFKTYATWFGGPAPYLFFMFAHPLHQAVSLNKNRILLSGFGGDQAASGQIPLNFFMPNLLSEKRYHQALTELNAISTASWKKYLKLFQFLHPKIYQLTLQYKKAQNIFRKAPIGIHPYHMDYYTSLREAECSLLQGPNSHEVRMRIEYSSIASQKMGFEYRYPLLYPKLLEFILSIPLEQKRKQGQGRYLMRRYLSDQLPNDLFNAYTKKEGLGIIPSTFDLFQTLYLQNHYHAAFQNLPYARFIKHPQVAIEMRRKIKGYMLMCHQSV